MPVISPLMPVPHNINMKSYGMTSFDIEYLNYLFVLKVPQNTN